MYFLDCFLGSAPCFRLYLFTVGLVVDTSVALDFACTALQKRFCGRNGQHNACDRHRLVDCQTVVTQSVTMDQFHSNFISVKSTKNRPNRRTTVFLLE